MEGRLFDVHDRGIGLQVCLMVGLYVYFAMEDLVCIEIEDRMQSHCAWNCSI